MLKRRGRAFTLGLVAGGGIISCSAGGSNGVANGQNQGGAGGALLVFGGDGGGGGVGGGTGTTNTAAKGPPVIDKCGASDLAKFNGGTTGNRFVYPYDGTVFPRGLSGPLLMWDAPADQILVEAKSAGFTYRECLAAAQPNRFQIPDDVWADAGAWSNGSGDPLVVTVTILSGGKVVGPITVNLTFALATLKGAIYYNTYGTPKTSNNGAVMKLLPGQPTPTLFLTDNGVAPFGPCRSCHALSANGMMMTANHHFYPGLDPTTSYISESYDVTGPTPTLIKAGIPEAGFAGIYPDGSRLMTNGPPNISNSAFFPTAPGNVTALVQGTSKLLDARTAADTGPKGWNAPHAQMPMFSPDGKHIVYNDYDKGQGHSLFVADYDYGANAFSNQRQIFNDPTLYAAWPFFTPDSKVVIFSTDTRPDFTSQVPDILGPPAMTPTGRGHLVAIDVATARATTLDLANGYKGGQSYLPAGEARDNNLEFFPTVSPISAGGFFWALFTSRRTYGNLWTKGLEDPTTKKIWVTAISIDMPPGQDSSHPPFLLPGQEIESGNVRAFAALEPCKEDGSKCSAGSECCKGYCTNIDPTTGLGICGALTNQCAATDDKCTSDADCCSSPRQLHCYGGFCGVKLN